MKIAHIVPYIGNEVSGPAYSVPSLCSALQRNGCEVILYTLNPLPNKKFDFEIKGFKRDFMILKSFGFSYQMLSSLLNNNQIDLIHNHSFWMAPNIFAGIVSKRKNIPLVNAPRGTMSDKALSRSVLKKSISKLLGQKFAIHQSTCFHTTAEHETLDLKKHYPKKPIIQIPNGVDIPQLINFKGHKDSRKILYLGRIHPIKGIENLIDAWALIENQFQDWSLDIVGLGESKYLNTLRSRIQLLNLKKISLKDPVYGQDKLTCYQEADIYVLPSYSENFGMTVAEALANSTTVITTNATPWSDLNHMHAGWCIDVGVDSLHKTLINALSKTKEELFQMGDNGREWMKKSFSWDKIAQDMIKEYENILSNKTMK